MLRLSLRRCRSSLSTIRPATAARRCYHGEERASQIGTPLQMREEVKQNIEQMTSLVTELNSLVGKIQQGGSERDWKNYLSQGKLPQGRESVASSTLALRFWNSHNWPATNSTGTTMGGWKTSQQGDHHGYRSCVGRGVHSGCQRCNRQSRHLLSHHGQEARPGSGSSPGESSPVHLLSGLRGCHAATPERCLS